LGGDPAGLKAQIDKDSNVIFEEWILLRRISDRIYRISRIFFACGEIP
jgi:hypothetical protein